MMKITKIILKILNLALIFMLFSCERDLYEDKIYQSKINIERVSLKDKNSKTKIDVNLFEALSKIKSKNNNFAGKIVYDSINDIYFDDETGIKITKDNYESYTFKVIKESGKLENLLFSKDENQEYKSYLIKYDYTEDELKNLSPEEIKQREIQYINLTYGKFSIPELICIEYQVLMDNGELHGADTPPTYVWVTVSSYCFWSGGSEGGGGADGGNSNGSNSGGEGGGGEGGGGGNGYNPSSPIITLPVHGGPKEINHIEKLNSITNVSPPNSPPNILRNKIMSYHYGLPNATQENGVEVRKDNVPSGSPQTYSFINPIEVGYDFTKFGNPLINTIMYIHFHHYHTQTDSNGQTKDLSPMFSDGDLTQFAKSFNQLTNLNSNDKKNLTSILVSKNGLFAMRVGDENQLLGFNDWLNTTTTSGKKNSEIFNDMFVKNVLIKAKTKALEIYNAQGGSSQAQLDIIVDQQIEKWFVKFIKYFNQAYGSTGILLFKGIISNGQVTWSQLTNLID